MAVAVGTVDRLALVGEAEGAHASLGDSSTALPGGADREADATVAQPTTVTLVIFLEAPGSVELSNQCQLGFLASAGICCLLEAEGPGDKEDETCKGGNAFTSSSKMFVQ